MLRNSSEETTLPRIAKTAEIPEATSTPFRCKLKFAYSLRSFLDGVLFEFNILPCDQLFSKVFICVVFYLLATKQLRTFPTGCVFIMRRLKVPNIV